MKKKEKERLLSERIPILKKFFKNKTNLVGIDLGTKTTGFYSDKTQDVLIASKKTKRLSRIIEIKKQLLNCGINNNSLILIEDYSFAIRNSSLMQIAELGGVVKSLILELNGSFLTIAPQTLKKFVLGPSRGRRTGKDYMLVTVLDRWHIKFDDDNVCDAFCLYKFLNTLRSFIFNEKPFENRDFFKWEIEMFESFIINRGIPERL